MPDHRGWLTKNEMMDTGAACFIPDAVGAFTGKWYGSPPSKGILLTRKRCKDLGCPVVDDEEANAYMYIAQIKNIYRYAPFYHRNLDVLDIKKITYLEQRVLQKEINAMEARKDGSI